MARGLQTRISLGSDAHHPGELGVIELGLAAALRAAIPRERIVNFKTRAELDGWIAGVRERARRQPRSERRSGDQPARRA